MGSLKPGLQTTGDPHRGPGTQRKPGDPPRCTAPTHTPNGRLEETRGLSGKANARIRTGPRLRPHTRNPKRNTQNRACLYHTSATPRQRQRRYMCTNNRLGRCNAAHSPSLCVARGSEPEVGHRLQQLPCEYRTRHLRIGGLLPQRATHIDTHHARRTKLTNGRQRLRAQFPSPPVQQLPREPPTAKDPETPHSAPSGARTRQRRRGSPGHSLSATPRSHPRPPLTLLVGDGWVASIFVCCVPFSGRLAGRMQL